MAITSRLFRVSRPLRLTHASSTGLNSNGWSSVRSLIKAGRINEQGLSSNGKRKSIMVVKSDVASETAVSTKSRTKKKTDDSSSVVSIIANAIIRISKYAVKRTSWKQQAQIIIEKGFVGCRFFTLLAVAGSLLGSILCFLEGCFFISKSYFEYIHRISNKSGTEQVMQLLIEATDMFLMGGAMIIFGMGLYFQFVGTGSKENKVIHPRTSSFGRFHLKGLSACLGEMRSVTEAKSKIGHAILMILQVGVLEKFKSVPMVNGFDFVCFGGAVLVSSTCVFILSKLTM